MNINNILPTKLFLALLFSFASFYTAKAQNPNESYTQIDEYVKSAGKLDTLNMATIASLLTKKLANPKDKARAIFVWIATNISYETSMSKANNPKNNTTEAILKNRKATSAGYAALFQDMCSIANIRCLTVEGFLKKTTEDINETNTEINHTWNVVQLGQSAETWFYIDAALASGYVDKKTKTFIPAFDDAYFFANKTIFNFQHYPDNERWQIDAGPKTKKSFYELPVIKNGTYYFNITNFTPRQGVIKTKTGKAVTFNFSIAGLKETFTKISLQVEVNKKQQLKPIDNFVVMNGSLQFSHTFDTEGRFIITILINDKETLQYLVEVE